MSSMLCPVTLTMCGSTGCLRDQCRLCHADTTVKIGGSAPGTFVCLLAIAAAAIFLFFAFY